MTGSLVVEKIFAIPGVGSLLVTAIQSNDYNVVIGLSFIYSAMYIGIMLVVDLLYGIIDPRIRLAKGDDGYGRKSDPTGRRKHRRSHHAGRAGAIPGAQLHRRRVCPER